MRTSAVTLAPETLGLPILTSASSIKRRTSENSVEVPGAAVRRSISKVSPSMTLYCFPPVRMTATFAIREKSIGKGGLGQGGTFSSRGDAILAALLTQRTERGGVEVLGAD